MPVMISLDQEKELNMSAFELAAVATVLDPTSVLPSSVRVAGWVTHARFSKRVGFLALVDGSSTAGLQVVLPEALLESDPDLRTLGPGCSLEAWGARVASVGAGQCVELQAQGVQLLGKVADPKTYPIQPKPLSDEFLRTVPHLRVRTVRQRAMARLRHGVAQAIHTHLDDLGFLWVPTPILTGGDAEGAGARFEVIEEGRPSGEFFGRASFLTVSGQMEAEAMCAGLGRVYTFGPTFRAEHSQTSRHLAEFWMVEPEMAFADLVDVMDLAEGLLRAVLRHALLDLEPELALFAREGGRPLDDWRRLSEQPWSRITYTEAVERLAHAPSGTFKSSVHWGEDLQAEHERWLTQQTGSVLTVTHYPQALKAFYMKPSGAEGVVEAMDVLVPGMGELMGGSVRESDETALRSRMLALGMDPAAYAPYLDLRRYGTVPHAGFGLGLERLVAYLSSAASVREAIPFPRWYGSLSG